MNIRKFTREITLQEGGKINLPIGQVGEVVRLVMIALGKVDDDELQNTLNRYRSAKERQRRYGR